MAEAHAQWEALRADPSTRSDLGGPTSSRLRLAIPGNLIGACFEESSRLHYQGQYAEQSSRAMKSLKVEELDTVKRDLFRGYQSMSNAELRTRFDEWESVLPGMSMLNNTLQEATGLSPEEAALNVLSKKGNASSECMEPCWGPSSSGSSPQVALKSKFMGSESLGPLAMASEDCMLRRALKTI